MINFIARRVVNMFFLLIVISFVGFWIIQLPPGSILDVQIQRLRMQGGNLPESMIQALRERYGVDDPFYVQYWKWISRSLQGDFGTSFETDQKVAERIYNRLGFSITLSLIALIFTWVVSIPIGVYSATHRYTWPDYLITFIQFLGLSIPGFLLALILLITASRLWDQPIGGLFSPQYADALANQQPFEGRLHALGVPASEGGNRRVDGLVVARFGLAAQRGELLGEAERFDGVGVRGDIALQLHRVHKAR